MAFVAGRRILVIEAILLICICNCECLKRVKRIVGGSPAAKPPLDDPVVFVNKNDRNSNVYGSRDPHKGFYVFRGIRYAEPPVGQARFQRPRAVHLNGEYNATAWGPPCPQLHDGEVIGSEDCLFLNVFTPALPDSGDGYPVLIWIHGGGFRAGAATQFGMRNLVDKRMIIVSIQYRLGSLGFLSTGTPELPGNNGLFDMTLAVAWVKKYIEYFGGNPKRIVAMGHGTGASAAMILSSSSFAKDSFSGLIAMSGSLLSNFAIDKNPMKTTQYIASANRCPTDKVSGMVKCLRELPAEQLISVDAKLSNNQMLTDGFISGISSLLGPGPVVEGNNDGRSLPNFVTDKPENILSRGYFPKIPLLTGVVKDETGGAIFGGYKDEVEKKMKSIPEFLNKALVTSLQNKIPYFGNNSKQFVPDAFSKYLKLLNGDLEENVKKIAEAVSDAIFNVPAFLTVSYWCKRAKTYFYSFDHKTKHSYGKNFLSGLPLVDAKNLSSDIPGHGDELGFIFDHNDMFGNRFPLKSVENQDAQVTESFTNLIHQFARTGHLGGDNKSNGAIPSFSSEDSEYISITDKITPMKNFRFCQMGLWVGAVEKLMSPGCNMFRVTTETVERLEKETKEKIVDFVASPIGSVKEPFDKMKEIEKVIPRIPNVPKFPNLGFNYFG